MSFFNEGQSIDCIKTNLRKAIENIGKLHTEERRGATYVALRRELNLIGDQCGLMYKHREDYHWLTIGNFMREAHKSSRKWLTGWRDSQGVLHDFDRENFRNLKEILIEFLSLIDRLYTKATHQRGPILPTFRAPPRESGDRIVQVRTPFQRSAGGVILPSGYLH